MDFKAGDYVTRKSYHNDIVFKILNVEDNIAYLKGLYVRLYADSPLDDLENYKSNLDDSFEDTLKKDDNLDRNSYFYLPARILHCDADKDYLNKCLNYYKGLNLQAVGKEISESDMPIKITKLLKEVNPDILVITGHDAYYKRKGNKKDSNNYLNSKFFVQAVRAARQYEKSHEKLIIIAGACQSNYEELITSGADFASSPKRVNIHALDPAIIASTIALTNKQETIDLLKLLNKTKYGSDGIGGVICNGLMYVGYPR